MSLNSIKANAFYTLVRAFLVNKANMVKVMTIFTAITLIVFAILIFTTSNGLSFSESPYQYNRILLDIFRLVVLFISLLIIYISLIMLYLEKKLEYLYLLLGLGLGVLYMFVMTPLTNPDEPHHFHSSYLLSGYLLFDANPLLVDSRHFNYEMLSVHLNISSAYLRLFSEGIYALQGTETYITLPDPFDISYPIIHLPQALGISIARLFNLSFFGVFYFGRIFNLFFYIACVFFAIKRVTIFKLPLLIIGLLPISLHQAASFNPDSFINGITILFFAYAIYYIYEKEEFKTSDFIKLLAISILLAPAKTVYLPFVFMVFLIAFKYKGAIRTKAWIFAFIIVIMSVISVLFFLGSTVFEVVADQEPPANVEEGSSFTFEFVLSNPGETIMIFLRTIVQNIRFYTFGAFGQYLSGFTLHLPTILMVMYICIFLASAIYGKKDMWQKKLTLHHRLVYATIFLGIASLVMASMFFWFTSDNYNVIMGVQGRYFTPLLPLGLIIITNNKININSLFYRNFVIFCTIILQIITINYIVNYTIN